MNVSKFAALSLPHTTGRPSHITTANQKSVPRGRAAPDTDGTDELKAMQRLHTLYSFPRKPLEDGCISSSETASQRPGETGMRPDIARH